MNNERRLLALVSVAGAVSALDLSLMFVAYPSIRADFAEVPLSLVSWVLTTFTIVAAALLIPAGRIADRVGRKRVFLTSLVLFSLGSLSCAIAPTVPLLIAARFLQAIGGALLTPSSLALVMAAISIDRRAWAIGVWSTVSGAMATAAPTIGALLVDRASWRWAFLINVPIGLGCLVLARRWVPESRDPDAGPLPDPLGVVLVMGGVATLAYGVIQSSQWGWTDRGTLILLGVAVIQLLWLIRRCATHSAPVIDLRVFRPFVFRANALASIVIGVLFWGIYYVFVQFLTVGWGYSIMAAGLLLIPMTIVSSAIGVPSGRMMDRYGHRAVMAPAALCFVAAMAWLYLWADDSAQILAVWIPAAALAGVTSAVCFSGVNSAGAKTAPPETLGVTAGIIQTLIRIGGTIGAALGIALVGDVSASNEGVQAFDTAFLAFGAGGVVMALAVWPLATRKTQVVA